MFARHNIFNGIWLMNQQSVQNYIPLVINYLKGSTNEVKLPVEKNEFYVKRGDDLELVDINETTEKGVLVLSIKGAITKHDQYCGPRGMVYFANQLRLAYANDKVVGIILKIESGGGEGNAYRLMAETLKERNKPIVSFIDDFAASAAYGIATNTDYIVANTKYSIIGSVGVYYPLLDFTEKLKKEGIRAVDIYAPQSKDKNKEYREFLKGNTKPYEELAKELADSFIEDVANTRADKLKSDDWKTGKTFFAYKALEMGLIDNIDNFTNTINYFSL